MVLISAMNGLSVAGMAIGATIALPELLRRGYDKIMVTGVIQAGSSLGILVPPSVVLVLYGMIARQPVGQLWLAGVLPGLMMAALFIAYIAIRCQLQPHLGPVLPKEERAPGESGGEAAPAAGPASCRLVIFASMTGLFLLGCNQPGRKLRGGRRHGLSGRLVLRGRLTRRGDGGHAAQDAGRLLHVHVDHPGGAVLRRRVRRAGGQAGDREGLFTGPAGAGPWQMLILMQLSFILMGTFLDDTAMLVIVAPLYVPLVNALGFDLVWYGVLYTITCQIAYMTPPFGYNLFLMRAMAPPEVSLLDIYRSIAPFVAVMHAGPGAGDGLSRPRHVAAGVLYGN